MSSLDDIVTIVEFHRRRWKPPASLTISLTKSLRVAGSLTKQNYIFDKDFVIIIIIITIVNIYFTQLKTMYIVASSSSFSLIP